MDNKSEYLHKLRHSAEHVLTQAMLNLYGKDTVIMAMGPATDEGFYFDFDSSEGFKITEDNFKDIEREMHKIVNRKLPIVRKEISAAEARKMFKGNPYKQEWLDEIEKREEPASVYWTGDEFVDLCAGPHVENTGEIKAIKLLSVAGAYWHGDEKNKMLTRIYGTAFETEAELKDYLWRLEEAKKRDHKKLGVELDLFTFSETVGKGLPLFTAKGGTVRRILERFIVDEELRRGYQHVYTPDIANLALYKKSGHYPYYKDTMYAPIIIDEDEYMLRPMTCPHHFELYLSKKRSYRELPMRIAELARLYRYEKSGELAGLMRVRTFCLADAHIIARKNQAETEIENVLDLIEFITDTFGLKKGEDYRYRLSLGSRADDKKYFKDDAAWDYAENVLREVLKKRHAPYYEAADEAAFYGPKIDIQMKNVLGKEETAFTVQYDFVMPKRFGLVYTNEEGNEEEAIVVHRSSIGAIERVMAFLIEHFAGAFPLWLAPVQAVIIPISEDQTVAAKLVTEKLIEAGIRAELWDQAESMQKKIRTAEKQKVPYMLVIGQKEAAANTVSVRARGQQDLGVMPMADFVSKAKHLNDTRSLEL